MFINIGSVVVIFSDIEIVQNKFYIGKIININLGNFKEIRIM